MQSNDMSPDEAQEMRYDMLGNQQPTEAEKLEKYTGTVDWDYLKSHFEQDALLYVDPSLQLAQVGNVIAGDDKVQVESWLKAGDLLQPGPPHSGHWESSQAKFTALVVSPFVLIQPRSNQSP
ncbi:MAG: DUF2288 family protein [Verrucomicrobiales bacterium]